MPRSSILWSSAQCATKTRTTRTSLAICHTTRQHHASRRRASRLSRDSLVPSTSRRRSTRGPDAPSASPADLENDGDYHSDNGSYNSYEDYPRVNEATRRVGMDEYAALKAMLLRRTWKFGALFSVYLFLVLPSTNASVMELVGCAASYAYLTLLMRHIDGYTEDSETPMFEAERVEDAVLRGLNKTRVGLGYSLNGRLLIPVGLVAGCAAYNWVAGSGGGLSLVEEGCMIGGFLGYKVALITKIYDDLKPKVLTSEELMREKRPDLVEIAGDVDDDLLWDGKKK